MQIADARNLRRALVLTSQLAAFGRPMVLVLNMVDEAHVRGVSVAADALSDLPRHPGHRSRGPGGPRA
jgi:ferrous iron transport protein B